ncbi:AAA family ATPase [Desulfopila aestuarii]|uniref:MoxR-like ATPase n=1 Tax=Desulfopila aestuarii DSM 18488 TaxID=1121416 RepID=A0A1M7YIZ6_9BACT|nr:MoxR family ATPase [Desulfopila aestuarii]SHO52615.1 MoxR-like ATPase [Desulfopila aestuarii DSM 18488]
MHDHQNESRIEAINFVHAAEIYQRIAENIQKVIRGKSQTIKLLLAAFFAGGHVLLEDVPGTGKTTLAKTLARSVNTKFGRLQFTPDLLPSDIVGVSIYRQHSGLFEFIRGPVFTSILLADEINRASPRTQSALLEAMEERQVTVEGQRHTLGKLFFVIATQNPVESHGTYPLPESQMDRFMIELVPGYLDRDMEAVVLNDQLRGHTLENIQAVANENDVENVTGALLQVRITEELRYYIVDLVSSTRNSEHVVLGAGMRASLSVLRIAQALALFDGRQFVVPEDIVEAAPYVLAHRLQISSQAKFSGVTPAAIIDAIIESTPLPK